MTDKVISLFNSIRQNQTAEDILEAALDANITEVVVIGYTSEGNYYFNASQVDGGDILWMLEDTKRRLFEAVEDEQ